MLRSTLVWALVALNALLLAALVGRWMKPSAAVAAPVAAGANRPGDYIIVPAEVVGGNGAIVYVIDNNQYSYSTPNKLSFAGEHLADRGPAYGF